ncbi:MAG: alpha-amylase family glycosyl hydrolase [Candidatus Fervidibacter sp.]|uniref:alpha-amylase family glycosyl hydrolase n=1 Tax=Candidatus Fervidibacter sp. TaxID=3100871 RepID=UPI004048EE32
MVKSVHLVGLVMALATMASAQGLELKGEFVSFRFDSLGNIVGLMVKGKEVQLLPLHLPVSFRVDGKWWHEARPKVSPLKTQRQRNRADFIFKVDNFVVTVRYQLHKNGVLKKNVVAVYEGKGSQKIDGTMFLLPAVDLGGDAIVLSPSFDFLSVPVAQLPRFNVDMGTGAWCSLYSPSRKLGVVASFYCETEHFSVNAETLSNSQLKFPLRISHWLGVQDQVSKGWSAELGDQFFIVTEGDEHQVLSRLWDAYELLGLKPLPDTPKDVFDGAFYEPAVQHNYRNIIQLLPHLKRLGVKTIWLPPYTPGVYAPLDYFSIRPDVGTAEELKALVSEAHRLSIRVLLDLIPHGPRPESELGKEQRARLEAGEESLICVDEQGKPIHWWGCYAFDYAHPGWIEYMAKVAAHFARGFGIDGWRVDVAPGGPPNWSVTKQPYPRRRPSQSGLWGGLQVLREARKAVKEVKGEVVFYPEASGPPFIVHGDFDYGFPFHFAAMRLMTMPPREFVPKLRTWLQHQRFTFPKGGSKRIVRWLANHDNPDVQGRLGFGYAKAMFAVCAVIEGVPFLYEGQDVGLSDFIARLMRLRSALTELKEGEADYLSVKVSDEAIFAVHRFSSNRHTVALVNLSGEAKTLQVRLPSELANWTQVGDAWTGKVHKVRKGVVTLTLPPFEPALLTPPIRAQKLAPTVEKPKPLKLTTVTVSSEGFLSVDSMLTAQWREGEFKIAPGERTPFEVTHLRRQGNELAGKLTVKHRMGATVRTVAEIDWRWERNGNFWRYKSKFQIKIPIKLAHHDLAWQFAITKPRRWRVATVEGTMEETTTVRHQQPQLIWDFSAIPSSPTDTPVGVQMADGNWFTLTEWMGNKLQVWLHPNGTLTVQISPDGQGNLSFSFALDKKPTFRLAPSPTFPAFSSTHAILSTKRLRLTVSRSLGGLPIRLEVLNAKSKGKWQSVLIGSELYSDYGIFPERDEGGAWRPEGERRMIRTVGRASACRYPDKFETLANGFVYEGALSITWAGHWWVLNPRINYSLQYETDGNGIAFHAKVETVKPIRNLRAFLALTLTFISVEKVEVNTVKGWHTVPEVGERDWQSKLLPLNPNDPQIRLHTAYGTIPLKEIEGKLQNCFVLKDGNSCTVFFAWLDGEQTDFDSRSVRFKVE